MSIREIVEGHINEAFGSEQDLAESRLAICRACPLMKKKLYGFVCDSTTYLNVETNETSLIRKPGFEKGCGCRLEAKTRLKDSKCPLGKW